MIKQLQKHRSDGFTIIEVLIVLAIAGLIMVVVFLAVPAIQRSQRNNALGSSANNILTAVSNYSTNNGGSLPDPGGVDGPTDGVVTIGADGSNQETVKVDRGVADLQLNGTAITKNADVGTVQIVTGSAAVCNSTGSGLDAGGGGSTRSYVILYVAESSSGGGVLKCIGG